MVCIFRSRRFLRCFLALLMLSVSTSAEASILDGLIHYWPFDETDGATAHDMVGHNDGELLNWKSEEPRWVAGKYGNALDFGTNSDGNDNVVHTTDPIVSNEYTISFFLQARFDSAKVNPRLIGPASHYWLLINQETDKGVGFYYDHGGSVLQDAHAPVVGQWEHYALTLNRTTGESTVYRAGFPVATGIAPDYARAYPDGPWNFGHPGDPSSHDGRDALSGLLDEIRIYNRVLSPDEMIVLSGIATSGDFDRNGVLDAADIDALTRAVRGGQNPAEYDINSDGQVNQEDRRVWVAERKTTYFGDADLNGQFSTGDLVYVFLRGKYNTGTGLNLSWEDGDWNGDGTFDSGDLVAAFQDGGYETGSRSTAVVVPEPSSLALSMIGLLHLVANRRRSRS